VLTCQEVSAALAAREEPQKGAIVDELIGAAREDTERPDGVALIAAERERQVSEEGWTAEHDDQHPRGELATAAAFYALDRHVAVMTEQRTPFTFPMLLGSLQWPFQQESWKPSGGRIRCLIKAGALIAAEIDRLLRVQDAEPSERPRSRPSNWDRLQGVRDAEQEHEG
jgi:hypothetical protein